MLALLDFLGFNGKFDFLYLPLDWKTHGGVGYAFINLIDGTHAKQLTLMLEGFSRWPVPCSKVCRVSRSELQGLEAFVHRYRNSPLMHEEVPDNYRPMLFADGQRVAFPPPTKKIKPPRQGNVRMFKSSVPSAPSPYFQPCSVVPGPWYPPVMTS